MRETLVVSHVTLVISSVVVTLGPVSVIVVGVVLMPNVQEVHILFTCNSCNTGIQALPEMYARALISAKPECNM